MRHSGDKPTKFELEIVESSETASILMRTT
jgi:hypothetical protein